MSRAKFPENWNEIRSFSEIIGDFNVQQQKSQDGSKAVEQRRRAQPKTMLRGGAINVLRPSGRPSRFQKHKDTS